MTMPPQSDARAWMRRAEEADRDAQKARDRLDQTVCVPCRAYAQGTVTVWEEEATRGAITGTLGQVAQRALPLRSRERAEEGRMP